MGRGHVGGKFSPPPSRHVHNTVAGTWGPSRNWHSNWMPRLHSLQTLSCRLCQEPPKQTATDDVFASSRLVRVIHLEELQNSPAGGTGGGCSGYSTGERFPDLRYMPGFVQSANFLGNGQGAAAREYGMDRLVADWHSELPES